MIPLIGGPCDGAQYFDTGKDIVIDLGEGKRAHYSRAKESTGVQYQLWFTADADGTVIEEGTAGRFKP